MVLNASSSSNWPDISLPGKRVELLHLLAELSDRDAQHRFWIMHEDFPSASGIDEVFHFIFDDTDLGRDAYSEIGRMLRNRSEADRLQELSLGLGKMLDRLGDQSSEKYMSDSEWESIVVLARSALMEMSDRGGEAESAR